MRILVLLSSLLLMGAAPTDPMSWPDLLSRPRPQGGIRIPYGGDSLQHVDLWLPKGKGPFPVVVMVHGGCWMSNIFKENTTDWIADDLAKRDIAV